MAIAALLSRLTVPRSALLCDPATTANSGAELLDQFAHGGNVAGQAGAAVSVGA